MSDPFDVSEELADFQGHAPLFPLPNGTLFPHVLLPLHMFEPRYRQMTADVLEGDRFLALATLQPGFESLYKTKSAPIYPMVCLGRVTAEERLPDGRFFLVLKGLSRARVIQEWETDHPYRIGELKLLSDDCSLESQFDVQTSREKIARALGRVPRSRVPMELRQQILDPQVPIGTVCDLIAYTLQTREGAGCQQVLETIDVPQRFEFVLQQLWDASKPFPPPFSSN